MVSGAVRWLIDMAQAERARLLGAVLLGAAASAATVALMGTSAYLISRAAQQPPILTLTVAIVAVRFFGISRAVARYAERLVGHDAAFRVIADLRVEVYRKVEPLVPARLGSHSSGDIVTRFARDVDSVSDAYLRVFPPFAIAAIVGTLAVAILSVIDPLVGGVLAGGLVLGAVIAARGVKSSVQRTQKALAIKRARHADRILEMLDVLPEAWVANTTEQFVERVNSERADVLQEELSLSSTAGRAQAAVGLVTGATVVVSLLVGSAAVTAGSIDGVMLAVLVLTPLAALDLISPLPEAMRRWEGVTPAIARIRDLLDAPDVAAAVAGTPTRVNDGATTTTSPASSVAVSVSAVTVRWPGNDAPTLRNVSLEVPAGGRVAIVGPSGSGKSTLAMTLAGFLRPETGKWWLLGRDTSELPAKELHATVGLLEQRPYIFDSTLAENLLLARPTATDEELARALDRVGLAAWVNKLPMGPKTSVGEHGRNLSGGQRQRLGLARLLLADHPILVLDEPDEHLDANSGDALMADLMGAASNRTTVVISHRLAPVADVDYTVVMDRGVVVESGPHAALVTQDGWYARIWDQERRSADAVSSAAPGWLAAHDRLTEAL
jgi:ATP-binding cassette subfamily C protein CydCD